MLHNLDQNIFTFLSTVPQYCNNFVLCICKSTFAETPCWQDWLVFADIFFFLMKSGCLDFLELVHKLSSRVAMCDQQILKTNHVTWLLAQIIRIEIVMTTLSSDPKKVSLSVYLFSFDLCAYALETDYAQFWESVLSSYYFVHFFNAWSIIYIFTCYPSLYIYFCYFNQIETTRKIISFHKDDKNPDSNNVSPQSILLDFISSSQTLRIWSFNSSIREYLNNEQLQKGKQIDEWWKQVTKGICFFVFLISQLDNFCCCPFKS